MKLNMNKDKCDCNCGCGNGDKKWWKHAKPWHKGGGGGHIYGLGVIGSLFYFLPHVANFQEGIVGIVKSIIWPALLVFKALELLKF